MSVQRLLKLFMSSVRQSRFLGRLCQETRIFRPPISAARWPAGRRRMGWVRGLA